MQLLQRRGYMSEAFKHRLEHVCMACVGGLYERLCNPKNQGEAFTWEQFPELAAEVDLVLHFEDRELTPFVLAHANAFCHSLACELVAQKK